MDRMRWADSKSYRDGRRRVVGPQRRRQAAVDRQPIENPRDGHATERPRRHRGRPLRQREVQGLVLREARRANLANGGVHVLRHTFCSHLAMRGAPARAIQELAGHQDLATTQRYMHLSPAALDAAIRLLETGTESRGGILEAAGKTS